MRTAMKTAGSVLALFAMVGQSWAAGSCARPTEAMALKTAAMQQELMVAALYCNDVGLYNRFVVSYQHELQDSDAALLGYFQHGHGGSSAYHAYKTALANDFSLSGLHGMQAYCSAAKNRLRLGAQSRRPALARLVHLMQRVDTEGYAACDTTTASDEVTGGGGSSRMASNRRN